MPEEPWEITEEQDDGLATFVYTDRCYCATGDTSTYSHSALQDRIREKRIRQLPERLQALVDDLSLLQYSETEFLDPEEWEAVRDEIVQIDPRWERIQEDSILYGTNSPEPMTQFGFEIGRTLRYLVPEDTYRSTALLWGLILGIHGEATEASEIEHSIISMKIDDIETLNEERREAATTDLEYREITNELKNMRETNLAEIIDELGISDRMKEIDSRYVLNVLVYLCGMEDALGGEPQAYIDIDEPIPESMVRHSLRRMRDSGLLYEVDKLCDDVAEDITAINSGVDNVFGVKTPVILEQMYDRLIMSVKSSVTVGDLSLDSNVEHMVTATLNRLSSERKADLHTNESIVTTKESSSDQWQFTTYGECVVRTMFEKDDSTWMYPYTLDKVNRIIGIPLGETLSENDFEIIDSYVQQNVCACYLRNSTSNNSWV